MISCNEELVLKVYRTDDAKSLVQRLGEIVTNKLSSDTTVYCTQFIGCTCPIVKEQNERSWDATNPQNKQKRDRNEKGGSLMLEPVKKTLFGEVL